MRKRILRILFLLVAVSLNAPPSPILAAQNFNLKIPPVSIPLTIKDQTISITASGQIHPLAKGRDQNLFELDLRADLADLQQNMTPLLSSALDRDSPCGDRIAIQNATLAPVAGAALATVQLHYERWVCAKIFGKQQVKKLVGGNASIQLSLTPSVDESNSELRLIPELGPIQADGSLGELLRSPPVAAILRDKIQAAIQSVMQKAANLSATLPPAAQPYASIQSASFQDAGAGRLALVLTGQLHITKEQALQLAQQIKSRVGK